MAHPMKGSCTSKGAKMARYANGGSVSVAGYSRAPKGTGAAPKGYANGGVVEDLAAPGADTPVRGDRAPRGKGSVTNVNITVAPKAEPVVPVVPPAPPLVPPTAAAMPPPGPIPMGPPMAGPPMGPMGPMRNGGRVPTFKDGGVVKRAMGGLIPVGRGQPMPVPVQQRPTAAQRAARTMAPVPEMRRPTPEERARRTMAPMPESVGLPVMPIGRGQPMPMPMPMPPIVGRGQPMPMPPPDSVGLPVMPGRGVPMGPGLIAAPYKRGGRVKKFGMMMKPKGK